METPFQKILELLVQSPGNLIYHLVLAFSILASLQAAIIGRQNKPYPHMRRLVFGLGMLLLAQAALFFSSGLAWQGILNWDQFFPPFDRAVIVFSLVWIVWLWNFPTPARLGDLVTGFLLLGVVLLFLFTYSTWVAQGSGLAFNSSRMDWVWELAGLFIVLTGMAILLFSRPPGWGFGIGMLSLSLAGFAGHLLLTPSEGNLSGIIRLSQLGAYPLLATLLHRFSAISAPATIELPSSAALAAELAAIKAAQAENRSAFPTTERRRYSASPRAVHAWLEISAAPASEELFASMAKALAHTMISDLCFIVQEPNFGYIALQNGYDLIKEEEMKGNLLEQSSLPSLNSALQHRKALRICDTDPQPVDLKTLSSALNIGETKSMMFIPLSVDDQPQGGVLFLSPYTNRQWTTEDQNYLSSETELIGRLLRGITAPAAVQTDAEQVRTELQAEMENLHQENQQLLQEIYALQNSAITPEPAASPTNEIRALVALQEESQEQIAALQAENERLQAALREQGISVLSPEEFTRLESELRSTLQETAKLQNQLAEANARNLILERENKKVSSSDVQAPSENREIVTSIVQEMRQPMSSILGYTDLLLAESVGILGALQRKFLERIKASTERMHAMLNDLIQISTIADEAPSLLPQVVDLSDVIDNAVVDTSAQLREKNIALRVDLPEEMIHIHADRDAIQQIILHLLQNAGIVTPQEGDITLRARIQEEDSKDYLLLQVTDTGGGVPPEDLPKVFSRRYRAEMPLIQGLGDTGVGLSIAKTLTEAHGGRILVDSQPGASTTFSVLLPVGPITDGIADE